MHMTKQLAQTRELHTLYRKCSIVALNHPRSTGTHTIGVCKVCGMAYCRSRDPIHPQYGKWMPLPRTAAAKYIKEQRSVRRRRAKVIRTLAAGVAAKVQKYGAR